MEQKINSGSKPNVEVFDSASVASAILDIAAKGSESRRNINRICEEMYRNPEVFSILTRLMEKTCKPFKDGKTMRVLGLSADTESAKICQNYITALIESFEVESRLPKQTICLYSKGEVMVRVVSVETLMRKKFVFRDKPTEEEMRKVDTAVAKLTNAMQLVKTVEEIENPLEYYDMQANGKTVRFVKMPIEENTWLFAQTVVLQDGVLSLKPETIVHKILYPRLTTERVRTGEFDGFGEPIETNVEMGKGLLESAYPAFVDYMLDKASNQMAKDARNTIVNVLSLQTSGMNEEEKEIFVDSVLTKVQAKQAHNETNGITEYVNAQPRPSFVVTTMTGETGRIDAKQVGEGYDAGAMTDTKFYQTVLYGAFRAIKQEFGILDDNAGFSGGETLMQIRDAETDMIKLAQKALCELWTEVFHRYLERKGMKDFIGQFRLEMNPPRTQADSEAENRIQSGIQNAEQVMAAVEGKSERALRVFRAMLNLVDLPEEVAIALDEMIEPENEEEPDENLDEDGGTGADDSFGDDIDDDFDDDTILDDLDKPESGGEVAEEEETTEEKQRRRREERLPPFSPEDFE